MIYYCSRCRLILPQDLVLQSKKCPACAQTPAIHFGTEESLRSQGYRPHASADPVPGSAPSGITPPPGPRPSAGVPVEAPHGSRSADRVPPSRPGSNSRVAWMDHIETPAPDPVPPQPGTPAPNPAPPQPRNPGTVPVPPQPRTPGTNPMPPQPRTSGTNPMPVQPGTIPPPPGTRSAGSTPAVSGRPPVDGGPVGGSYDRPPVNWPFIGRLVLLLAAGVILGLIVYGIWSVRDQIIEAVSTFLFIVIIIVVGFFMFRPRRRW